MKIAMMTNNYKPFLSGVAVSVERLAKGLRELGHEVVVFAPNYDKQEEEADVFRYGTLLRGVAGGFSVPNSLDFRIERAFRKGNFDVIHVHHPMMIGRTAIYLSWKYHVPLVFTCHTRYEQYLHYIRLSGLKGALPFYLRGYMKHCDMVLAPAQQMKDYLEELQRGSKPGVRVLPTGLFPDSFFPDQERASLLRRELAGERKFLFCTVSRLAREKNQEFLLRALKLYKEARGDDFRMVLIGGGPWRRSLERLAVSLNLENEVVFTGNVSNDEIKNYCYASDLFLFSSLSETQGIVLLESMAVGTPVIALRAAGTEDVINNGVNGYMTGASEKEFSDKLMDILEKKEIDILRQGALRTAGDYDCHKIARKAVQIYEQALRERKGKEGVGHGNRNPVQNMVYSE